MISTVYAPKKVILTYTIKTPMSEVTEIHPTETYFESAIFQVNKTNIGLLDIFKMIFIGPKLVLNSMPYSFEDTKRGGEQEFHKSVCSIIEQERIEELVDETNRVYYKYGYSDHQQNIWSLWQLRKIQHIFLLKDRALNK